MRLIRYFLRPAIVATMCLVIFIFVSSPNEAIGAVKYEITPITIDSPYSNVKPTINHKGQIIWTGSISLGQTHIFFYSGGQPIQLTNEYIGSNAVINNIGQVAYSSNGLNVFSNGITTKISTEGGTTNLGPWFNDIGKAVYWLYEYSAYNLILHDINSGIKTPITDDPSPFYNGGAQINNKSHIVWRKYNGTFGNLFLSINNNITNLTNNNQSSVDYSFYKINNIGQIVYYCSSTKQLMLYDSNISNIPTNIWSNSYNYAVCSQISNRGIVWSEWYSANNFKLYFYDFNTRSIITIADNCYNNTDFHINDLGQIVWSANGNIFLWTNGVVSQITNSTGNVSPQINNLGQIVYVKSYYGLHNTDLYLATPQIEVPFKLTFPIKDPTKNYNAFTVPISAVMDHSNPGIFYASGRDGKVLAFNDELGDRNPSTYADNIIGYQNAKGTIFFKGILNYNDTWLWYDGHSGYDFAVRSLPVIAPADGKLYIPQSDFVNGNNGTDSPWNGWHTFYIDHGNGYSTWYLHCAELESQIATVVLPGGTPKYDALADVKRGQQVATTGAYGAGNAYHLHFEVRKNGFARENVTDAYKEDLWKKIDIGAALNLILAD